MVAALCGFPARPRLRPHAGSALSRRYERCRPEKTPLHKIVSENLESWLEWRDQAERPVPGYVEEELRGYLEYLADHVIPPVPVRQWVISVPKRLQGFLADRPAAVAALGTAGYAAFSFPLRTRLLVIARTATKQGSVSQAGR